MYRGRPWTMRQYAGFGSAQTTNERWKMLLAHGTTGLSCAFDLPTQMGYDSDHPRAEGEVGKVGVAIDSLDDMRQLLSGLPLDQITTSMTINATAAILLLLYELVAEEQGVDPARLGGTIQNDILKEYIARGTYIYPPRPSMRLITDIFAYCREHVPKWNTISISGYHIREAGSTAVQEIAFTLANGIAYVDAAVDAGLPVDEFAPRLCFFWNAHNNFFEEVAKYRAARRMWAEIMTERFGAKDDKSKLLRFHTQTGGSTLTAQQPENNIVRVTLQGLAAVLGGTQSLHTNGFDEALGLPTERAAGIALRTQQIIAAESGVVDTVDPLAGSYFVEALTDAGRGRRPRVPGQDRRDGRGGRRHRGRIQTGRDRAGRLRLRQGGRRRGEGHRRGQRFVEGRPGLGRGLPDRPGPAGRADRAGRHAAGRAGRRRGERRAGRRGRRRPGHPEPARPDEGGPAPPGHPRRGERRAPRGIRGLPAVTLTVRR